MGYNEWSDDENSHGRDKFRPERSYEETGYERRKRGRRSPTPPEERRYKRRPSYSPPPMRHYQSRRDYKTNPDADHYIPNYERDGYNPGPRYGSIPEPTGHRPYTRSPNPNTHSPMMDMMPPHMMNRSWNGNMGGFPLVDPTHLDYLVSFKQFSDYTKRTAGRRIEDDEIQKRFAHYKEKFSARQAVQFFEANKEKEWFKEKYHPTISRSRQDNVKERRRRYLTQFLEALERGDYDQVRFDKDAQSTTTQGEEEDGEPEVAGGAEDDGNAEYEPHLVIKTVPPTIAREKIIEMCQKVEGFDYLVLSEPSPNKKFQRIGWIKFKEGTDIKKKFEELDNQKVDDFVFHLALNRKNMTQERIPRIAPEIANTTERLQKDLEQAKELAVALEAFLGEDAPEGLKTVEARAQLICDKHTESTIDELEETDLERWKLKKNLDLIITYLRHVHMYCYYCGLETDSLEELARKCVDPHCRTMSKSEDAYKNERSVASWVKNLDNRISLKIHTPDDRDLEKMGGRILQSEIDEYIKEHVLKEHESKYKCQVGECSKAFKGIDYVEKHILAKHPEEIERIKSEVEYLNNYVCDPNHIVPSNNNNNPMNQNMMPMAPFAQPFMMGAPRLPAAMAGTPFDQIPRVGFDPAGWSRRPRTSSAYADLESSLPKDPRQITSYVDLDAPAEGDSNISFY